MATAVCHRQEAGVWSSIFPPNQQTEQQSAFFVKKLLAVSVSYLTYLRNIFPEQAFGSRNLGDLELKVLQESSSCPGANKVCQWVRSCFDALNKKFLNSLVLGLYVNPADPNTLLESYSFKFNYEEGMDIYHNEKKILTSDTDNTKKTTTTLLRTILVLTQGLKPLPDNVMLTMKLFFNEDVTPVDYHPPGFVESKGDDFVYEDETVNIKVGEVGTKFHSMKMRIRTKCHNFEISPNAKEVVAELTDGSDREGEEEEAMDTVSNLPGETPSNSVHEVSCVCGSSIEDGMLIMCVKCEKWSHALCYKIIEEDQVPESHICATCPGKCSDISFTKADKATVQATALWRRALITLTEVKRVTDAKLAQRLDIDLEVAKKLMVRLTNEGFIKRPTKGASRYGYLVNKSEIVNRGRKTYFSECSLQDNSLQDNSLQDSGDLVCKDDASYVEDSFAEVGGKRKRVSCGNDSFELSSSQNWNTAKRLRSSVIRTPVKM